MEKIAKINLNSINKVKRFPDIASKYESDILLTHGNYVIDGTSLMGIMSLDLSTPVNLCIIEKNIDDKSRLLSQLKNEGFEVIEDVC